MKYSICMVVGMAVVLVAVLSFDRGTMDLEAAQYCDMVHLHQQSAGELGWPDYQGTYAQQCTPDGKLRRPQ